VTAWPGLPPHIKELQAAWDAWNKQQKDPLWIPAPAKKK
jgi:hypothetical protein